MKQNKNIIVSFRLPEDAYARLKDAVEAAGDSISDFARQAVSERIIGGSRCYTAISGVRHSNMIVTGAPEYWNSGSVAEIKMEHAALLPYRLIVPEV